MENMDRTRIVFIAILGIAIVVVCGFVAVNLIRSLGGDDSEVQLALDQVRRNKRS